MFKLLIDPSNLIEIDGKKTESQILYFVLFRLLKFTALHVGLMNITTEVTI